MDFLLFAIKNTAPAFRKFQHGIHKVSPVPYKATSAFGGITSNWEKG